MKPGFFLCIVGPSGAGKDSLIDAAREQLPSGRFEFARRIITRDAGKPGEIYDSCTEAEFDAKQRAGEFLGTSSPMARVRFFKPSNTSCQISSSLKSPHRLIFWQGAYYNEGERLKPKFENA